MAGTARTSGGHPSRRRRLVPGWVLLVAFVVVPLVEIYVIVRVGEVIGAWWTIVLLIADSLLGSWLVRREGGRAFQALRHTLQEGRMPARELADGALILAGGLLMVTPGFVLDVVGVLFVLPFTRPVARAVLSRFIGARLVDGALAGPGAAYPRGAASPRPGPGREDRPGPDVVRGDVVD